jgi:arylsulfatase
MIPHAQIPRLNRSHTLEAEIVVPAEGVRGVLATFGFRNKGFAWYVRDGQLIYENRAGVHRDILLAERRLDPGKYVLRYQFVCETCQGQGPVRTTVSGTARLFIDGTVAAEQRLEKVNLNNAGEGVALNLGRTGGSRVSDDFEAPFPFTGNLQRLTITLD